ncbi:MAG: GTPase ObgE [Phycisphaerales bacterium]
MFVDRARILIKAGKGGDGKRSFRRSKGRPKGGPDGGDGGRGGDVILASDDGINTLIDFRGIYEWKAENGEPGGSNSRTGADADSRTIRVPPGTMVYDEESGELLADLGPGDREVIARGGFGGFGNEHFKTSTNQAPREAIPGHDGEMKALRLELKVIAEVGLVGLPNAGKSSLLKTVTRADPKIADYPFTTLSPQLGIALLDKGRRLIIADIPGLIEGAAEGAGLGHDFLRHVERTEVIVHVLDVMPPDGSSPAENYRAIRQELMDYSPELAEKREIIALNKLDLLGGESEWPDAIKSLRADLQLGARHEIVGISGGIGAGTDALLDAVWDLLHEPQHEPEGWPNLQP